MLRGLGKNARHDQTRYRSIRSFLEKKTILLPEDQYQALVELVGSPLTPQEIEGRKKLKKVPDWNL